MAVVKETENGEFQKNILSILSEEERQKIEITEETELLYNKILKYEDEKNGKLVEVKGYLPIEAQLQVEEVTKEQIEGILEDVKIGVAYDIKIVLFCQ